MTAKDLPVNFQLHRIVEKFSTSILDDNFENKCEHTDFDDEANTSIESEPGIDKIEGLIAEFRLENRPLYTFEDNSTYLG